MKAMNEHEPRYKVTANHEDVLAVWPVDGPGLPHWRDVGMVGTKAACLAYIDCVDQETRASVLRGLLERDKRAP
jgi:MbtH protein